MRCLRLYRIEDKALLARQANSGHVPQSNGPGLRVRGQQKSRTALQPFGKVEHTIKALATIRTFEYLVVPFPYTFGDNLAILGYLARACTTGLLPVAWVQ